MGNCSREGRETWPSEIMNLSAWIQGNVLLGYPWKCRNEPKLNEKLGAYLKKGFNRFEGCKIVSLKILNHKV